MSKQEIGELYKLCSKDLKDNIGINFAKVFEWLKFSILRTDQFIYKLTKEKYFETKPVYLYK
jgi:hypothetical protein